MSLARALFVTVATVASLAACAGTSPAPATSPVTEPAAPSSDKGPSSPARADVAPKNGLEVVGAMRRAHPAGELKSMSFTLAISEPRSDSTVERSATGIVGLPGRYRQASQPSTRRSGTVRDRERLAVFEAGKRVGSSSRIDIAQLLAYDVFAQRIDSTVLWLDIARVRLGIARRDRWDGRDVWVVGAVEGDTTSTQFWVDEDRWRVLRVIQRDPRRPTDLLDVRYREFENVMRVPVAREIDIYRNGRHAQTQRISDIVANPKLPRNTFDLQRWREVKLSN